MSSLLRGCPGASMPGGHNDRNRPKASAAGQRFAWTAASLIDRADMGIGIALYAGDTPVAPVFPFADRVLAVPDFVEAFVLPGQAQVVALAHVQVGAGNGAAAVFRRHRRALLEVHHEGTGAVLSGLFAEHAEAVVAAVAIDLADHRHQVVQVGFGLAEDGVLRGALLAPALLPALALMADHPGRDYVFPLDACGAFGLLAWNVAAAGKVDPIAFEGAAAIEIHRAFGIDRPGDLLGFAKGTWRIGLGRGERQEQQQKQGKLGHGHLDDELRGASMRRADILAAGSERIIRNQCVRRLFLSAPARLIHSEARMSAPPIASRSSRVSLPQTSRLMTSPTGTDRLFITA